MSRGGRARLVADFISRVVSGDGMATASARGPSILASPLKGGGTRGGRGGEGAAARARGPGAAAARDGWGRAVGQARGLLSAPWRPGAGGPDAPQRAVRGLMGANAAVFGAWALAESQSTAWTPSPLLRFLSRHFVTSDGRPPWCLATSAFSHRDALHLGVNLLALWSFGPSVGARLGARGTVALYLACGVAGSALHNWENGRRPGLGASGAVFGFLAFEVLSNPHGRILTLLGPVPAWGYGLAIALLELSRRGRLDGVSHSAHVGGGAAGAAA